MPPTPGLAVSTTSAVPITQFFVVQPVDVCTDAGTGCAYINNSLQTVLSAPYACTVNGVSTKCANLLAGFNDPGTGMTALRNIWSAIGIDARQTPVVQYNSTASQTLTINNCIPSGGTTGCTSSSFSALAQQPGIASGTATTFPRASSPLTMNEFFVKNICSTTNPTLPACTKGDLDGFGALNGNGSAIANLVFLPTTTGRPDSRAHEKGHNFDLDHATFGAGGSTNLMTTGSIRMVPGPTVTSQSKPSDLWVLEVSPNSTALDLLTMGTKGDGSSQQGQALLSGFLNATPQAFTSLNVPEVGGANVQTAAASPQAKPANSPPFDFVIQSRYSDACQSSSICASASLAEVVIVLTQGKFDNSSGNSFSISYQYPNPVLTGTPQISHGNNGNDACLGLGPTTWCLDLTFVPGAFSNNNGGYLDFTIGTKPTDPTQLAGTVCYFWESSPGVPYYNSCADISSLFSNSQMVNLAINPLIPVGFAGTPGNHPCTTATASCPDPTSSYTQDADSVETVPQLDKK
jgi:hypothetical protein